MWLLSGPELNGKTRWLRPGKTYSVGRSKSQNDVCLPGQSTSRKHATLQIIPSPPGSVLHTSVRSQVILKDLKTKMGTNINDSVVLKDESLELTNIQSIREKGEVTIRFGGPKDGDKIQLTLKWVPMVIAFSSGESGDAHTKLRDDLINDLQDFDIKLTSELSQLTSYYMKPKSNSSKLLTALVMGIPIVKLEFSKAIKEAFQKDDNMELDFYNNLPNPEDYLPEPSMKVNIARKTLFEGKTFIFTENKERDALLSPITSGEGKAIVYENLTVNEPPIRIKNFVESKVKSIDDVVLVGYRMSSDDNPDNQEKLDKLVILNEAAKLLGIRLFSATELLDVILQADASRLNLRRAPSEGTGVVDKLPSYVNRAKQLGNNSFLETSTRKNVETDSNKIKPIRRKKFQPRQLDIMQYMGPRVKTEEEEEKEREREKEMEREREKEKEKEREREREKDQKNVEDKSKGMNSPISPVGRRKRPYKITDDILVPVRTVAPDVTENAREYKRRKLNNVEGNSKIPADVDMFDSPAPGLINDDENEEDGDSGEPREIKGNLVKWSGDQVEEEDEEENDDIEEFKDLAIVEATLAYREKPPPPAVIAPSGKPNFKRFRAKGPRPPRSIHVGYIEAVPTNLLLEQDMAMFNEPKERNTRKRASSVVKNTPQRPSKRRKTNPIVKEQEEEMFVNSDEDSFDESSAEEEISSVTQSNYEESAGIDAEDDNEFTFSFRN